MDNLKGALSWPFLRLYMLTLLYFCANSILNVIIPLKGDSLGASNSTIGIIMGAYLLTTMVFRPWAGHIIQRHGPIKVLRLLLIVNGLALFLYTFTTLESYFIARILQGMCTAFFSMALQLSIVDALPEKERSQGISMYSLCASMPGIIGPLLAVGMWGTGDMTTFKVAMILIAVVTGVAGFSIRMGKKEGESITGQTVQGASFLKSFSQLFINPFLFKCSILMLIASIVFGATTTYIPLYAIEIQGGSAAIYLMIQAGTVVGARFFLRKKIPSDGKWHSSFVMLNMLVLAIGAQSVSYSTQGGVIYFYCGACLLGISQALLYPTLTTYLTFVLPKVNRNVLLGLFIAMADLGISLGSGLMGLLVDMSSYSLMYSICAVLAILMVAFAYDRRRILMVMRKLLMKYKATRPR